MPRQLELEQIISAVVLHGVDFANLCTAGVKNGQAYQVGVIKLVIWQRRQPVARCI